MQEDSGSKQSSRGERGHGALIEAPGWKSRKKVRVQNTAQEFRALPQFLHGLALPFGFGLNRRATTIERLLILSGHPKPANDGHLKTANDNARDIDSDEGPYRLGRHEQCLERRRK